MIVEPGPSGAVSVGRRPRTGWPHTLFRGGAALLATLVILAGGLASAVEPVEPVRLRISELELIPQEITQGCTIAIRFQVYDPEQEARLIIARWVHERYSRRSRTEGRDMLNLPTATAIEAARRTVTMPVRPIDYESVTYSVYVEDRAGNPSNVLSGSVRVRLRPLFGNEPCR